MAGGWGWRVEVSVHVTHVHASGGAAAGALAYAWPGHRELAIERGSFTNTENAFPSRKPGHGMVW